MPHSLISLSVNLSDTRAAVCSAVALETTHAILILVVILEPSETVMLTKRRLRKRPRPSYACIECTRRKLRCSKHIPCSACIDRGIAQLCRRRTDDTVREQPPAESAEPKSPVLEQRESSVIARWSDTSGHGVSKSPQPEQIPAAGHRPGAVPSSSDLSSAVQSPVQILQAVEPRQTIVHKVTEDAAIMLEFLALSRQNVRQAAQIDQAQSPRLNNKVLETFDPVFTANQVRAMMLYHQECMSWIHNVVHLPTFRDQCEHLFINNAELQGGWLALYYAMLSVRLYSDLMTFFASLTVRILRSLYTTLTPRYYVNSTLIRLVSCFLSAIWTSGLTLTSNKPKFLSYATRKVSMHCRMLIS